MLDREMDKKQPNKMQNAAMLLVAEVIREVEHIFKLDPIEVAAVFGKEVGDYCACHDDIMAHDPEWIERAKAESAKRGIDYAGNAMRMTAASNFDYAYDEHIAVHKKIREGKDQADSLLKSVCESHKKI